MALSFLATVEDLFRRLSLGMPRIDATGIVRLRVDALAVNLSDDGRGACRIEGRIGTLPAAGPARAAAVRAILRATPGFLLANEAGVFLRSEGARGEALVAFSSHPLAQNAPERLIGRIEDVLTLVEFHAHALTDTGAPARAQRAAREEIEDAVIFRL
ncbi:hypothetical protein [uncultured Aureimonas sp.]|uniref:hypothetical protein n=1 Tax=uncultured Aureimonas sp. TaxID=1604662 RepID=UPI0025E5C0B7|nr:hypothetical protein [uncultured Aureimonas sp.]